MYRVVIGVGVIFVWLAGLVSVLAQDLTQQKEALKEIRETAADICYTVQQQGQQSETQLSGEVQAKLSGVIARVADLGIKGAGELKSKKYRGVLQEQLASTLAHSADCKKDVFDKLVERILPRQKSTPQHEKLTQRAEVKNSPDSTVYQAGRDLVIVLPAPASPNAPNPTIQSITLEARLTCTTRSGVELPPEKVDLLAWFGGDATLRGPAGDAILKLVSPVYFERLTVGRLVVINRFVLPEDSHLRFRPTQVLGTYSELLLPITTVVNTYSDAIDRIQLLELSLHINGGDPDYQSYRYNIEFVRDKGVTFTVPLRNESVQGGAEIK